ncbi:hypothetical protein FC27_GL000175 [Companilactobacillus versmoldensis DSM 14857 = KCTC 3814]|uniref:Uncharacterized protein n=2 Tax=Companilactobacillus versmoldensis TaxID=194326 RepID=A0A0R1SGE5_9LACO|nr:hypothetical protein FC27_GL000175 [Companilactobacillus versmoldensis DSM 14857 = KCTC 3814]
MEKVVILVNFIMKIDRFLGAILVIAGIVSFIFKWFSNQTSLVYILVGIVLIAISATADKNKRPGRKN